MTPETNSPAHGVIEIARADQRRDDDGRRFGDAKAGQAGLLQVRIRTSGEGDNVISCELWNGTSAGAIVSVQKPPTLRRAIYDGTTNAAGWTFARTGVNTRSASKTGETTVSQAIDPPYKDGSILYVQPVLNTPGVLQDINADGRVWAQVC